MRPLWYEFPQDAASWTVEGQHLVGDSLLVAPVLTKVCKLIFQDSCFVKEFFRVAPLSMCTSLANSSTGMITGPTRDSRSLAVTMLRRHMKSRRQREKRTPTRRVDAKEKWMPGRPKKREKQQNKCQQNGRQYNGPEHIWPE